MESKKKYNVLIWMREDMRFMDNFAIETAYERNYIPLFLFILKGKMQDLRNRDVWYYQSLINFIEYLNAKGISYLLLEGNELDTILYISDRYKIDRIFWNRRYSERYRKLDEKIKSTLKKEGIQVESFKGNLLHEPWEIKNGRGDFYRVFTPYYKNALASLENNFHRKEKNYNSINFSSEELFKNDLQENLKQISQLKKIISEKNKYQTGEKKGIKILDDFILNRIDDYPIKRDFPSIKGTSMLSAFIARGDLGIQYIWDKIYSALNSENSESVHAFLRQLIWREFAWHVYYYYPSLDKTSYKKMYLNFPWNDSNDLFKLWKEGETGYAFVDSGMWELNATGYMHNRPRMVTASFLTKHLRIHWKKGMKYFEKQLIDHDDAINAFSWQWVAGSGMDAAPYFRIFNPISQYKKFDSQGEYFSHYYNNVSESLFKQNDQRNGLLLSGIWKAPTIDIKKEREKTLGIYYSLKDKES